jgi:hypothetical protein
MEAKRRAEHEVEHEAERMLADGYERPEGNGKAPMECTRGPSPQLGSYAILPENVS